MNVDDVVAGRIEAARRKIATGKERRAAQECTRDAGLALRHAAKLCHLAEKEDCMPSTIRIDRCPACRVERVHRRVAGAHVQGRPHDVMRCTHGPCGLLWLLPVEPPRTGPVRPVVGPASRGAA